MYKKHTHGYHYVHKNLHYHYKDTGRTTYVHHSKKNIVQKHMKSIYTYIFYPVENLPTISFSYTTRATNIFSNTSHFHINR